MAQKNETPALILSLLITIGLIGAGVWWFTRSGTEIGGLLPGGSPGSSPGSSPSDFSAAPPSPVANDFAGVPSVPSGLFNYGGSTTWAPIRGQVDPVIQSVWSGYQLRYTNPPAGTTPGSASGIRMLLDNQLSFSQSSRSLIPQEYQEAEQRGFTLREIPVALEGIAIAVNPNLNISGLTLDQLRDIYLGQITNWNQVGGPDLPITPYSRRVEDGGTVEFFVANILGGQNLGNTVTFANTTTQALREVSADPGGVYYASAPEIVGQCTVKPIPISARSGNPFVAPYLEPLIIGTQCGGSSERTQLNSDAFQTGEYPITRRLFVVIKQNNQADQQAGEAYANLLLTDQGQSLIEAAGFVRIR
jgi:phosphate transport system substrate-binding protein